MLLLTKKKNISSIDELTYCAVKIVLTLNKKVKYKFYKKCTCVKLPYSSR